MSESDDSDLLITVDVDPREIAQLAQEDFESAIAVEKQSMEGMTKSDARAWIDRKTRSLQRSITALAVIRNTLSPMNNLPDEILVEIFWHLSRNIYVDTLSPKISWLAVGGVCRRWHRIVVGTPKLYTCIDARRIFTIPLFLARSCETPIDIYLPNDKSISYVQAVMTYIQSHLHRVKTFDIRARYQGMQAFLSCVLQVAAPMLESLHLEKTARRILGSHEAVVVPHIFNNQTPSLRRLYLRLVSIPWTSPIYTGLTDLELALQHHSTTPTMETFVNVLESCPLLESLYLSFAGPTLDAIIVDCPPPLRVVELAHLKQLYLELNRPIDTQYLLAHIGTPTSAFIIVSCALEHSDQYLSDVLPQNCVALRGLSEVRHIRLHAEDVQSMILTGYTNQPSTALCISLSLNEGMLKPRKVFSQIGRFFPLSHLEHLEIVDCAAFISKDKFVEVLSELGNLTHLTACESGPVQQRQLLAALMMPPVGSSKGVVCSRMEVLRLSGLDAARLGVMENLAHTCRSRALKGSTLKAICIAGLDNENVLPLLDTNVVATIDISDTWVNGMFSSVFDNDATVPFY